ncbi:MAG: small acid-soluble spore protein Tlp [Firmicutes bacterium]|nr:small acid-soluble spore protein Tlp [Bacillota bacterium]
MAKPDHRADNVQRIQQAIDHTMANAREAENFLAAHEENLSEQDEQAVLEKNQRREQAIRGFRQEIQDEAEHQRME